MGYNTDFYGQLSISPSLTLEQKTTIQCFNDKRHSLFSDRPTTREESNQYNTLVPGVPGYWCQWTTDARGEHLEWDGGEKFYHYREWLQYLIDNFFTPWGCLLNGEIMWDGEEIMDIGKLIVRDNVLSVRGVVWEE